MMQKVFVFVFSRLVNYPKVSLSKYREKSWNEINSWHYTSENKKLLRKNFGKTMKMKTEKKNRKIKLVFLCKLSGVNEPTWQKLDDSLMHLHLDDSADLKKLVSQSFAESDFRVRLKLRWKRNFNLRSWIVAQKQLKNYQ